MFAKLALRNVRRQVGNYLIYFITVTFTVALMFAIHNVIFSKELLDFSQGIEDMNLALVALSVMISLVIAFVLGYATAFMLRLRKREFGTYLTLGMTRRNIRTLFILEMVILGAVALVLGIVIGFFLYQGLMMIVMNLVDMQFGIASYSAQALVLTVVLVVVVFVLASVTSAVYLKKVSIYELIHGDKKVEKGVKHPALWLIISAVSFAGIIASFFIFDWQMRQAVSSESTTMGVFCCLIFFAVCLFLFHVGLCRGLVWLLMRNQKFCARGSNTFILRQLSGQLRANAVIAGILSFLIAFSIIGTDAALAYKSTMDLSLNRAMPFDVMVTFDSDDLTVPFADQEKAEQQFSYSTREMEEIIDGYRNVEGVHPYRIYMDGTQDITAHTWWGEGYEGMNDLYIPISSYNELLIAAGWEPLDLRQDQYYIVQSVPFDTEVYRDITLEKNGVTASFGGVSRELPPFADQYFVTIIPDKMAENMDVVVYRIGYDLEKGSYDAEGLQQWIFDAQNRQSIKESIGVEGSGTGMGIKELSRRYNNGMAAVLVVGALYVSVAFVFLTIAVLALKVLAGLNEDRRRYAILFRLGCGRREQSRALFRQLATFFFLPFAVPIATTVPIAAIIGRMMENSGYTTLSSSSWAITALVAALITAIYVLYFAATYLIARRNIIYRP